MRRLLLMGMRTFSLDQGGTCASALSELGVGLEDSLRWTG